jgi:hypothetical protein
VVPGCVVEPNSDEPAEQQIVFQPLHEKTNKKSATASLAAASPAGSTAAQSANRAS